MTGAMLRVSIHAPAWGATAEIAEHEAAIAVSIHAPAWGATWARDPYIHGDEVSIHAPAWGATKDAASKAWEPEFQSTPPRGGRLALPD